MANESRRQELIRKIKELQLAVLEMIRSIDELQNEIEDISNNLDRQDRQGEN